MTLFFTERDYVKLSMAALCTTVTVISCVAAATLLINFATICALSDTDILTNLCFLYSRINCNMIIIHVDRINKGPLKKICMMTGAEACEGNIDINNMYGMLIYTVCDEPSEDHVEIMHAAACNPGNRRM
jgi:hypothetical protein